MSRVPLDAANAWDVAAARTLALEGGLSLDGNDGGNWTGGRPGSGELRGTRYGISAASYPDEDIQNLTKERALEIARRDFWDVPGLQALAAIAPAVAVEIFDIGYNGGATVGIRVLQMATNILTPAGDPLLAVDGVLGAATINAVKRERNRADLLLAVRAYLLRRYLSIVETTPRNRHFVRGWLRRAFEPVEGPA